MEMNIGFLIILLAAAALVHSQSHIGFISIDCGSVQEQYTDSNTNISYVSDKNFEETGINRNISPEYAYPINPNLPQLLQDLRSFPQGSKNCYSLNPVRNGSLNLIRATFLYGNYDGLNKQPKFDLYVEVNLWSAIKFSNVSDVVTTEIITTAMSDTIHVCLVNKGLGVPFISALELRPVDSSMYDTEFIRTTSASLLLFKRLDIGHINGTDKKYQDDMYDRIWTSYMNTAIWDSLSTSQQINTVGNGNNVPSQVIMTAAKPQNGTTSFLFNWSANDSSSEFYIYMYFAELEQLNGKNQSRKFTVSWNGAPMFGTISPRYLFATTISSSGAVAGNKHVIYFYQTEDSTHPPILNALEIYLVKHMDESPTYSQDVNAIGKVKVTYQISKNWAGDPCSGPKNLFWEGLKCSYNTSVPRIISLNLTSSNLSGIIAASIKELSSLEFLDLSNNSLTGSIPEFLEDMKSLKSIVDTQHLCDSGSCKKNNKIIVPVVASLSSAAVILILFVLGWILGRKGKTKEEMNKKTGKTVAIKKIQFSHEEILDITNKFGQVIGKGGFGTVYHGYMKDGNQVAVKMLSPSSSQGPREFKTEAELLMRVHHRNLVSFVGYCDDAHDHFALIYEYMANGNLKEYLSERSSNLNWKTRLHIAIDAAQELITGQTAVIKSNSQLFTHITNWVVPKLQRGDIATIVDGNLQPDFEVKSVDKALQVAMACTTSTSIHRPTMSSVLK